MLDGLKVAYANPGRLAGLAAVRLAYGGSAWGHPASGTPDSLPRIGRADLVALHAATFRPDRAVLILAGDIDAASALTLARAHFGAWKAPASAPLPSPPVPALAAPGPALAIIDMPSAGQAGVVAGAAIAAAPGQRLGDRRGAEHGPRRRLLVAPEPGDPDQARPQLRRRQLHRARAMPAAFSQLRCRPRTSRQPRS